MWGANKWTDQMFKRYWWVVIVLVIAYLMIRYSYD